MAARFCNALFKPCEWIGDGINRTCDCVGQCMSSCCSTVCQGFSTCCRGLGEVCGSACECCGSVFTAIATFIDELCIKPFSFCLLYTFGINLIPVFMTVILFATESGWTSGCEKPLHIWNIVCLIIYIINICFGFYTYATADYSEGHSSFERAKQFFLYDMGVCMYIVVAIFMFVWAIVGFGWADESQLNNTEDTCSAKLILLTQQASGLLMAYLFGGLALILLSLFMSSLEYCIEDTNPCKLMFCCIYYPFCYEGAPPGWLSRNDRRRAANNQGQNLAQPPVQIMQGQPRMAQPVLVQPVQPIPQQQSAYIQPPPAYQAPVQQPYVNVQKPIQSQPQAHILPPNTVYAQPVQPVMQGQPVIHGEAAQPGQVRITQDDVKVAAQKTAEGAMVVGALAGAAAVGLGKLAWKGANKAATAASDAKKAYDQNVIDQHNQQGQLPQGY